MPIPEALPGAPPAGERLLVRCRVCRRPLWTADARARQVGSECDGLDFAARGFDVAQDVLPGLDVSGGP